MAICAISTSDNPFNPITEFEKWKVFDEQHGYFSSQYLARLVDYNADMTDDQVEKNIEEAVDKICKLNLLGKYIKVTL